MIRIRKAEPHDYRLLSDIWLESSLIAHDFIPIEFWRSHQTAMEEQYLPAAEVYVAEDNSGPVGFAALVNKRLAAIFVSPEQQGRGIGNRLLHHTKTLRDVLELNVYQKNTKSLGFYLAKGFEIVSESLDSPTGEKEWVMQWENQALQQLESEYPPI